MRDKHAPRSEFIERLESQIGAEVRRRNRIPDAPRWSTLTPLKVALAAAVLILVSMAAGGAVVSAAYQAQSNERRDALVSRYTQRIKLGESTLDFLNQSIEEMQRRVQTGLAPQDSLVKLQIRKAEAVAGMKTLQLQLEEVRATGAEPLDAVSAPLVGGRDFVTERLNQNVMYFQAALQAEENAVKLAQQRVAVGIAEPREVDVAQAKLKELSTALDTIHKKLAIRKQLLNKQIEPTRADLLILEVDARLKLTTLQPQIALAEKELASIKRKVQVGVAQQIELAQAQVKLMNLQSELAGAQLELLLIEKKLKGKNDGLLVPTGPKR